MLQRKKNGHLAVVEWLHEKKADMNLKSSGNASAFFIAAQNGHLDVCLFLFKQERQRLRQEAVVQQPDSMAMYIAKVLD